MVLLWTLGPDKDDSFLREADIAAIKINVTVRIKSYIWEQQQKPKDDHT